MSVCTLALRVGRVFSSCPVWRRCQTKCEMLGFSGEATPRQGSGNGPRLGQATSTGSSAGELPEDDGTRCDFCFLFPSPQMGKHGVDGPELLGFCACQDQGDDPDNSRGRRLLTASCDCLPTARSDSPVQMIRSRHGCDVWCVWAQVRPRSGQVRQSVTEGGVSGESRSYYLYCVRSSKLSR